jgi:hypothetical protein
MRHLLPSIVVATALAAPVTAEVPDVPLNVRVRVTYGAGSGTRPHRVVGRVVSADDGSLTLERAGGDRVTIPLPDIGRLERSLGGQPLGSRVGRGVALGALAGAATGAILGATARDESYFTQSELAVMGTIAFAAVGSAVGGVIGASGNAEEWKDLRVPRPALVLAPTRGGLRAGIRIGF